MSELNGMQLPQPINSIGIEYLVIALFVLLIVTLIPLIKWIREPTQVQVQRNETNLKDKEELKKTLSTWKPIVEENIETQRDFKNFANLVRVICELSEKKTNEMVRILVGLTALVTIGELKLSEQSNKLEPLNFEFLYQHLNISIEDQSKKKEKILLEIEFLQKNLDDDSWEQFLKIAKFVEFPTISSEIVEVESTTGAV